MVDKASEAAGGGGPLSKEKSRTLLEVAVAGQFDASVLDGIRLDREAAAAFVADVASMIGVVAESAGLARTKLISEMLYTEVFREVAKAKAECPLGGVIAAGQARLN